MKKTLKRLSVLTQWAKGKEKSACMTFCLSLSIALAACSTGHSPAQPEPQVQASFRIGGKGVPNGRSDSPEPFAKLARVAKNPKFGFTVDDPIKVGGLGGSGPHSERLYLNALRGPTREPVNYERLGSCCIFSTPNGIGGLGAGPIDIFEVSGAGIDTKRLYLNMYDPGSDEAPTGFSLRSQIRNVEKLRSLIPSNASSEQQDQLAKALEASPFLVEILNEVQGDGRLTGIEVNRTGNVVTTGASNSFRAQMVDSKLVIVASLLKDLRADCPPKSVEPGDPCLDDTVFVLGHLASHAKTKKEYSTFVEAQKQRADAMRKAGQTVDVNMFMTSVVGLGMAHEASAFITGWNCVVDAATVRNKTPLTNEGIVALLTKLRYSFAIVKAIRHPGSPLKVSPSGFIELSEGNISAVASVLQTSRVVDIQ